MGTPSSGVLAADFPRPPKELCPVGLVVEVREDTPEQHRPVQSYTPASSASSAAMIDVSGSGNQIIVGSPNTNAALTVTVGDRDALWRELSTLGIPPEQLEALEELLDSEDEPGRLKRVLAWCRGAAESVGINTVASAAATLILQYLGLV